jgi:hypothetical protein
MLLLILKRKLKVKNKNNKHQVIHSNKTKYISEITQDILTSYEDKGSIIVTDRT